MTREPSVGFVYPHETDGDVPDRQLADRLEGAIRGARWLGDLLLMARAASPLQHVIVTISLAILEGREVEISTISEQYHLSRKRVKQIEARVKFPHAAIYKGNDD